MNVASAHPAVSVILPTYNRAELLPRAIRSVQAQTVADWELVVIDDGSTDATRKVLEDFARGDSRIRVKHQGNRGSAIARNSGIAISKGEIIAFIDSDDEYGPNHLELRIGLLRLHPEIEMVHGGVEVIGEAMVADRFDQTRMIPISECAVGGTFVIRRELLNRIGGFAEIEYAEDHDLLERVIAAGAGILKLDTPTYRYYRTELNSQTMQAAKRQSESTNLPTLL